jgi:hypothetical protein
MKAKLAYMATAILSACATAYADGISVSFEHPVTPFHRPSELHVRYTGDAGVLLDVKELEKSLKALEKVEVKRVEKAGEVIDEGKMRQEVTFILDPITTGIRMLPSVSVTAGTEALRIPPLLWQVRDLTQPELDAVGQFADIAMPGEDTFAQDRRMYWAGALAALLLAAALGAWWFLRRKSEAYAPPPPAWEVAYRRLKELSARNLPEQGKFERFYVDLSSILRYYIEDRYGVHAPEQTTPEFLEAASGKLEEEHRAVLAEFLRHCDRVKFARYEPTMNEMKRSYEIVKGFVDHTVPRVTVERETAPSGEAAA